MPSNLILSNQEIRKATLLSKKNSDQEFINWLKKENQEFLELNNS